MGPDQRKQSVALRYLGLELCHEVEARFDSVDIHQEIAAGEASGEMIVEAAGSPCSVIYDSRGQDRLRAGYDLYQLCRPSKKTRIWPRCALLLQVRSSI